mgnify:CR=1 FL=1
MVLDEFISKMIKLKDELIKYEKDFNQTKKIRALLKDSDIKKVVDLLIDLKKDLKQMIFYIVK